MSTPPTCCCNARVRSGVPWRLMSSLFSTLVAAGTVLRSMPEPMSGDEAMMSTSGSAAVVAFCACAARCADQQHRGGELVRTPFPPRYVSPDALGRALRAIAMAEVPDFRENASRNHARRTGGREADRSCRCACG